MQNIKLHSEKNGESKRAVCYRLFFFNISFGFSCLPSHPDLHHFSETSLDGISFSSCLSPSLHYFLTVPGRARAGDRGRDMSGGRGTSLRPPRPPHFSSLQTAGGGQIMLNVINLPDSWKSDMHELQRNLFYFAMKRFCIMRKKMSSVP